MGCCRCKCKKNEWIEDVDDEEDPVSKAGTLAVGSSTEVSTVGGGDVPPEVIPKSSANSTVRVNIAVYEDEDPVFNTILAEAEAAIEEGVLPERIEQGSSGSYFVKNKKGEKIGVFKPRDEEPYGRNNPKWGKWFQRHCCPCCFGRGCLLPNSGYLSEAGASIVDYRLGLNVVPKTKVIRMASTTFHYGRIKRKTAKAKKTIADRFPAVGKRFNRIGLPLKIGSFQVFVKDYKDAIFWAQDFETDPLPHDVAIEFQLEFERLVILDYVIRNTDRGHDNWLIRYDKASLNEDQGIPLEPFSSSMKSKNENRRKIKIAAIDNGLAFPFKHPDEWRAYPFRWAKLPWAKLPFTEETREKFLPLLSDINLIEQICSDLYFIFSLDKNFKRSYYEKQMSVLRGQVLNLANALRDGKSPYDLVRMPPVRVVKGIEKSTNRASVDASAHKAHAHRTMKISPTNTLMFDGDEYKPEFPNEAPVFSSW